jgi:hypothetical protein
MLHIARHVNSAMADGIFEMLKKATTGIDNNYKGKTGINSNDSQLDLLPD